MTSPLEGTEDVKSEEDILGSVTEQEDYGTTIPLLQLIQQLLRYMYLYLAIYVSM